MESTTSLSNIAVQYHDHRRMVTQRQQCVIVYCGLWIACGLFFASFASQFRAIFGSGLGGQLASMHERGA